MMTLTEQLITVAMVVLGTVVTRFLPFIVFREGNETPRFVTYLGKVLPSAVFGFLVIYSLKNVDIFSASHGIPELISVLLVILIHLWKRKMLLSIAAGTFCYMFLIQVIF